MTKRQRRAFKILFGHRFPNGRSVSRSDYYETENGGLIDLLIRSKGALEVPLRDSPPTPDAPLATQPDPARTPEVDEDVVGDTQPDWDYRTITDMRIWLDQAGAALPSGSTRKAGHVEACQAAWAEGLRPHPLWGLPGGRECAAGLPGPNALDVTVVEDAIATAEQADVDVPDELLAHLEALRNPDASDEASEAAEAALDDEAAAEEHEDDDDPDDPELFDQE